MKAIWLWNPESPGMRVLVVRGFWGRLFKHKEFATLHETLVYYQFVKGFNNE